MYGSLSNLSHFLQEVLRFVISQPDYKHDAIPTESNVMKILANEGTANHVDILIKNWLNAEEAIFRKVGAHALGGIRNPRAVPRLIEMLKNKSEETDVLQEVFKALGYIGGRDAVNALLNHEQIEPIAFALEKLEDSDFDLYDLSLQRLLKLLETSKDSKNLQTALLVYRAIGLKKDERYINVLRKLLNEPESL